MDCQEAQSLLSAYHDGELSDELRLSMAQHVAGCARCAGELGMFDRIAGIAKELIDPEEPEGIWGEIEATLDAGVAGASGAGPARQQRHPGKKRWPGLLVAAACLLIAGGVVRIATSRHSPGHSRELAADFEQYLEQFTGDPEAAQEILLAKYDGKPVDFGRAEMLVGYRPAVAAGLPRGYTIDASYVLAMPCCTCVQTLCRRQDGRVFAIFEHSEDQAVWCGDRPADRVECDGGTCMLTQVRSTLVATWKFRQRQLTIVGVQDVHEIGALMAHLDASAPEI